MTGVLYIVATPIGNLDDFSTRAIDTLKSVDLIAAEDTRHSKRLLNHYGISTRMISFHQHNEDKRVEKLLAQLQNGINIALISDAGTPLISDPGYSLVAAVHDAGIRVAPVPGANCVIAALSVAGLPTDSFQYQGFLSQKNSDRLARLEALKDTGGTLVLLESSHRIERLLAQLAQVYPQHQVVIAKELTKLHERLMRGTPAQLIEILHADDALAKGEFVVLIDNPVDPQSRQLNAEDIETMKTLLAELPLKLAVKIATRLTRKKKNDLYQMALQLQQEYFGSEE